MRNIIKPIIFIVFVEIIGSIGSVFTTPAIPTWYAGLIKPGFTPPNWLFGPVWIILYLLMGLSVYLIWEKRKEKDIKFAMSLFAIQLILNVLWSALFFGARSPFLGLIDIVLLLLAILATIFYFIKIEKTAALLLLPYLAWVAFAAALNFSILTLN